MLTLFSSPTPAATPKASQSRSLPPDSTRTRIQAMSAQKRRSKAFIE
jgi:hypothetical protein